jgi:hypothetical protein
VSCNLGMEFEQRERAWLGRMLRNAGEQNPRRLPKELTAFASMTGERFAGELVVVGRAPNGWRVKYAPDELLEASALERIVDETLQSSRGGERETRCPMLWVSSEWVNSEQGGYATSRSAFWRVSRAVVGRLGVADIGKPSWPSYLAWSNLYRVAPYSGGNPSASPAPRPERPPASTSKACSNWVSREAAARPESWLRSIPRANRKRHCLRKWWRPFDEAPRLRCP